MTDDRPNWDDIWLSVADTICTKSRCSRAQVGCVIVDDSNTVKSVSYNGPPPGYPVEGMCIDWCPRAMGVGGISNDYSNCVANHAEMNAISRITGEIHGGLTAYVNRFCCSTCAKALAGAKISRVVCKQTNIDTHLDLDATEQFLTDCGIVVDIIG